MSVTLKDIADAAEVSITTVSNALSGKGRISKEMQSRIIKIAKDLGYERKNKIDTNMIGLLSCSSPDTNKNSTSFWNSTSYYTHEAINGIHSIINGNFHLIYHIINNTNNDEIPEMVTQRIINGLLVIGGTIKDEYVLKLKDYGLPIVVVLTDIYNNEVNSVLADFRYGAYTATSYLIGLGHQNIGFINGWAATHTSEMKLEGFKKALNENDLKFQEELYAMGNFTKESGKKILKEFMKKDPAPSAIFTADDLMAIGAIEGCKELGIKVPDDVSIIGFGNSPLSPEIFPSLTTIDVPKYKIGQIAAKRLINLMETEDDDVQTITLPIELKKRQTCTSI